MTSDDIPELKIPREAAISALCEERNTLRQEVIGLQTGLRQALLAYMALSAAFLGPYFQAILDPASAENDGPSLVVHMILSQAEVFLALFGLSYLSILRVHGAYIAALEDRINELAGVPVNLWESTIAREFIQKAPSPFGISLFLLAVFSVALFAYYVYAAFAKINNFGYGVLVSLEGLGILILYSWVIMTRRNARTFSRDLFSKSLKDLPGAQNQG